MADAIFSGMRWPSAMLRVQACRKLIAANEVKRNCMRVIVTKTALWKIVFWLRWR